MFVILNKTITKKNLIPLSIIQKNLGNTSNFLKTQINAEKGSMKYNC